MDKYVTPYLPEDAVQDIRAWRQSGKKAFQKVLPQARGACGNCAGVGYVYVVFANGGPFARLPGGLATWYDGGSDAGEGWYTYARADGLRAYPCPHCAKTGR